MTSRHAKSVTLAGDPPLTIALRRTAQARRMTLRVSGTDGAITLSLPHHVSQHEAIGFLTEKTDWLRRAVTRAPQPQTVAQNGTVLVEGRLLTITQAAIRSPAIQDDCLYVPLDKDGSKTPARVAALLKQRARAALVAASDHYAGALGRSFRAITLRDTRSRWGSCTADGRLMYSWRLVMAPPEVLRYVAAHEVAHLAHMDHSPAFWACVGDLMPDYKTHKDWLRQHGASLHAYRFDARRSADNG